jgi:hypothetical protein
VVQKLLQQETLISAQGLDHQAALAQHFSPAVHLLQGLMLRSALVPSLPAAGLQLKHVQVALNLQKAPVRGRFLQAW